jgi:CubicO group peptidase (beta-lactamase class C family)
MVIRDGEIMHQDGYGRADLETGQPITPTTNFYLASIAKQFTTMAVMLLQEEGKLDLDAHLTDFFPDFPGYGRPVQLRHLLTHTSGLPDYYGLIDDYTGLNNGDVYALLLSVDSLDFAPGERYSYSNSAYVLLSRIVELAAGTTFRAFVQERIFTPLGMDRSVVYDTTMPTVDERATGYQSADDG